ncbi:hypothetical protein Hanom_Chr01g00062321 [Helianthus anomalus]
MMSSPVDSRPEAVILEEDGSTRPGNLGGDGPSPGFNYGSLHGKSRSQEGVVTPSHTRKVADEIPKGFNGGRPEDVNRLFFSQGIAEGKHNVGPESCTQVAKKKKTV